jgi:hypothetical protein
MTTQTIPEMDDTELYAYVLHKILHLNATDNDLIMELCSAKGWEWYKAKEFIQRVRNENLEKVQKKRSNYLLGLGAMITLTGVYCLYIAVDVLIGWGDILRCIESGFANDPNNTWSFLGCLTINPEFMRTGVPMIITGFFVTAGGLYGVWRARDNN